MFPSALDDPALLDKSFTGPGANYVFWDNLHPTSKTQAFIAQWCLQAIHWEPEADLTLNVGGNNNGFIGSSITMNGHYDFFDEDLVTEPGGRTSESRR